MINNRTMGEKEGYWTGLEIEHTQFYGDPTVFFSRLETAIAYHEHIFRFEMKLCEHVFLAVINPKFFQVAGRIPNPVDFGQVLGVARWHLNLGRRVTVEDWAINASLYTDLRICLLYTSDAA